MLLPLFPALLSAQEWRAIPDAATGDSAVAFDRMPPGWHVTTGPAVVVTHAGVTTPEGRYAIEVEAFLFPGTSAGAYGVFLGGADLDRPGRSFIAFLVRRDGSAAVVRRRGTTETVLHPWTKADSLPAHSGEGTVRAVLSVAVGADSVRFRVNGGRVAALARGDAAPDGRFGLRVDRDVNVHVSRLDATRQYAPPRGGD